MKRLILTVACLTISLHAQTPFSVDSAGAYLKTIAVEIGPRPMGSPNERRAMDYALRKFHEFRLTESYIMTMTSVDSEGPSKNSITSSGIAVGVLKGKTGRIIVIGGHIDSAGPEIPGADDDGSGSATVIELARALSRRPNESTIVFCLFGGEEQGLIGSKYFVDHFPQIDRVALMLQVDMANGSDWLVPLIDVYTHSAPAWLVNASYEEFRKLGYSGLSYPTHFLSLNNAIPGGGIGSDHQPFLQKNIPAIDFTSDIHDPIHTPQDNFENFTLSGLKRSGDLVYRLVERFDGGVPEEKIGKYYLVQIGLFPIFVPPWTLYFTIALSLICSGIAVFALRQRRVDVVKAERPKIPGLKLFLLMLIIQSCVWFSENLVGLVKGVRFPWFNDPRGYFALSLFGGLIGIWIALQFVPKLRLSRDPYRWYLRAAILLVIFLILASNLTLRLALYPATALVFLSLAAVVRRAWLKYLFWVLSPHFMFRLFFSEGFNLIARSIAEAPTSGIGSSILFHLFYILFFSLWSFAFLLGFASVYFDTNANFLWLKQYRSRAGIIVAGGAFLLCFLFLLTQPTFTRFWNQIIRVTQSLDLTTGKATTVLSSDEYLRNVRVHTKSGDTLISGWSRDVFLGKIQHPDTTWLTLEQKITSISDSGSTFDLLVSLRTKYRPYTLTLTYSSGKQRIIDVITPLHSTMTGKSISFRWYSFPDTILLVPIHFRMVGADSVNESLEATFVQQLEPLSLEKKFASLIPRTIIRKSSVVKVPH